MNKEERQDRELAAFTDALLEGQPRECKGRPALADTVEMLTQALNPQAPPASLRHEIQRQIAAEWEQQRPSLFQRLARPLGRPTRRWAWATGAALALAALAVALLAPVGGTPVVGTVGGDSELAAFAILLLAVGLVGAWLFVKRRK